MYYFCVCVLGDLVVDVSVENKLNVGMSGSRGRDEVRGWVRLVLDVLRMEDFCVFEKVFDE